MEIFVERTVSSFWWVTSRRRERIGSPCASRTAFFGYLQFFADQWVVDFGVPGWLAERFGACRFDLPSFVTVPCLLVVGFDWWGKGSCWKEKNSFCGILNPVFFESFLDLFCIFWINFAFFFEFFDNFLECLENFESSIESQPLPCVQNAEFCLIWATNAYLRSPKLYSGHC